MVVVASRDQRYPHTHTHTRARIIIMRFIPVSKYETHYRVYGTSLPIILLYRPCRNNAPGSIAFIFAPDFGHLFFYSTLVARRTPRQTQLATTNPWRRTMHNYHRIIVTYIYSLWIITGTCAVEAYVEVSVRIQFEVSADATKFYTWMTMTMTMCLSA